MKKFYSLVKASVAAGAVLLVAGTAQAFPTLSEIASFEGKSYSFTSTMTANSYDAAEVGTVSFTPTANFNFQIIQSGDKAKLSGFITTAGYEIDATYDATTGVLTFDNVYKGNSIVGNYAFVPGGIWNGYNNTTRLTLSFNEDGTEVTIPDFSFTKMSGLNMGTVLAEYTNCKATPSTSGSGGSGSGGSDDGPIVGIWEIQTADPYLEGQSNPSAANYEVTLNGNQVTFTLVSEYDSAALGDVFVATLGSDGTTLTFDKSVTPSTALVYKPYQVPFTNGSASGTINNLNETSFTAQFSETDGTITFATDQATGLRFANMDSAGNFAPDTDWQAAFNFVSASKVSDFTPELTLTTPLGTYWSVEGNSISITYNISAEHFDLNQDITWTGYVSEAETQEEDDPIYTPLPAGNISVDVNLNTGKVIVTIINLEQRQYSLRTYVTASVDGEVYATSNYRDLGGVFVGPGLSIFSPKATSEGNTVTLSARVLSISGMPSDVVFKLKYAPYDDIYPGGTEDPDFSNIKYVDATLSNNTFYGAITDLTPGAYNYAFAIVAYTSSGTEIISSDFLSAYATVEDPTAPKISLSNATGDLDDMGDYSISFKVELSNIEASDVSKYEATFSYSDYSQGGAATQTEEVTIGSDGIVSVVLHNMPEGKYAVSIQLIAYDTNGDVLVISNEITLSDYTTSVSRIGTEDGQVRYFNLNGVEVANPERGIYIRVQDGKATKVIR